MRPKAAWCLWLIFLVGLAGCGGGMYKVAKVHGRVTCGGQPVTYGNVTFSPLPGTGTSDMPGKAASGLIQPDGTYTLSTYEPNDGAIVGRHRVTISSPDPAKPLPCKVPEKLEFEVTSGDNAIDIELSKMMNDER